MKAILTQIIVFGCFFSSILAQRPTDLSNLEAKLAQTESDTARMRLLDKLGRAYLFTDLSKTRHFAIELEKIASARNDLFFQGRAAQHFANVSSFEQKADSAVFYCKRAVDFYEKAGDEPHKLMAEGNLAAFFLHKGDYAAALELDYRLLKIHEEKKDFSALFQVYQHLAVIYHDQKQVEKAAEADRQALAAARKLNSNYLTASAMGDLAVDLFDFPDSLQQAEKMMREAIRLHEKSDSCASCLARLCSSLVKFYHKTSRLADATTFTRKGLAAAEKSEEQEAQLEMWITAAQNELLNNRLGAALEFLSKAEDFQANEADLAPLLMEKDKAWAQYFFATGQPEKGFEKLQNAFSHQDSLAAQVYNEDLSRMQTVFQTEKAEREAVLLTEKNRRLSLKNQLFLALAALFGALFLGGGYFFWRIRRQKMLIETQKNELENLNATKDKFFAIIAHDLRGPIVSFHGLIKKINWLVGRGEIERVNQLTTSVDEAAAGLNKLLDNLLSWALIQRGTMPYNPEAILLREEAEAVVAIFRNSLDTKHLAVKIDVPEGLAVSADRNALSCILRNLTDNATKYSPDGSRIRISAARQNGGVSLTVRDNGTGMTAEQVERLFSISKQEKMTAAKGTGLGLLLCKELTEMNGGRLEVETIPEEGTAISIWLPSAN